jgi:mercuric reductase
MELTEVPCSLLIIGDGYVSLEQGQIFRQPGSEVTILRRGELLLPNYEPEVSEVVTCEFSRQRFSILTGFHVQRIDQTKNGYRTLVQQGDTVRAIQSEAILVASGRATNVEALELPSVKVEVDGHSAPIVNGYLRTTNRRI